MYSNVMQCLARAESELWDVSKLEDPMRVSYTVIEFSLSFTQTTTRTTTIEFFQTKKKLCLEILQPTYFTADIFYNW